MTANPHERSKTGKPGTYKWLERAVDDPGGPIEFDPRLNEYNLRHAEEGRLRIYHCPFCGGAAPRSKRALLFTRIDQQEITRLNELTKNLRTLEETTKALGTPDRDLDAGITKGPSEEGPTPGRIEKFRTVVYTEQSETAELHVELSRTGRVTGISYRGKRIVDDGQGTN